jgi:hypothetical protein
MTLPERASTTDSLLPSAPVAVTCHTSRAFDPPSTASRACCDEPVVTDAGLSLPARVERAAALEAAAAAVLNEVRATLSAVAPETAGSVLREAGTATRPSSTVT